MGPSQSEDSRLEGLEDAFSDEEGSGYGVSPTTGNSYRPQPFSNNISPGGDLSDEDICSITNAGDFSSNFINKFFKISLDTIEKFYFLS